MKIVLTKAIKYKDTELHDLDLDIENVTGQELLDAEDDLRRQGITVNAWEMSRPFLIQIASRAMHVPSEVLKGMSANDFVRVCNVVAGFLLGTATEELTRLSSVE